MLDVTPHPEGGGSVPVFNFSLVPAFEPEVLREQVRSALSRALPQVSLCAPHAYPLSVAAGGPSLEDTYKKLWGCIVAVNGSLSFLLQKGIIPDSCGVCDPSPHMADIVEAHPGVRYYLASVVHPALYDKLLDAGCQVVQWHCGPMEGLNDILNSYAPNLITVGGGATMGLRWQSLGYVLGFREFHLHGLDSSFRGSATHAYPDHQDGGEFIEFDGFQTKPNFLGQMADFFGWINRLKQPDVDPVKFVMYGEGLLQKRFREWQLDNPGVHDGSPKKKLVTDAFLWPSNDRLGAPGILMDAEYIDQFMRQLDRRRTVVQAGGNVGIYPAHLAEYFDEVHTFEPDAQNFACLSHNLNGLKGKIAAYHAALGADDGTCRTEAHQAENVGAIIVKPNGDVPMRTVDDLGLETCDLIWLDVEGMEEEALRGAEATVMRSRPAVIIEENEMPLLHGLSLGGARAWLEERGYRRTLKLGNDAMFQCI
jgi:FkbM family methyltransferase